MNRQKDILDAPKARVDAKLKSLPADRQAEIFERMMRPSDQGGGYQNVLKWLADDGFKTSLGALSRFYCWYQLNLRLEKNAQVVAQMLSDWRRENPNISDEELERAGQRFFSVLAIEQQDSLMWKRVQDAQIKLETLQLDRERFEVQTCKRFLEWHSEKKANEIAESRMNNAEKIAALRKVLFGDVDELEASGRVVIPE